MASTTPVAIADLQTIIDKIGKKKANHKHPLFVKYHAIASTSRRETVHVPNDDVAALSKLAGTKSAAK